MKQVLPEPLDVGVFLVANASHHSVAVHRINKVRVLLCALSPAAGFQKEWILQNNIKSRSKYLTWSAFECQILWHPNTRQVWYSNGRFVCSCQIVRYLNGGLKTEIKSLYSRHSVNSPLVTETLQVNGLLVVH